MTAVQLQSYTTNPPLGGLDPPSGNQLASLLGQPGIEAAGGGGSLEEASWAGVREALFVGTVLFIQRQCARQGRPRLQVLFAAAATGAAAPLPVAPAATDKSALRTDTAAAATGKEKREKRKTKKVGNPHENWPLHT
eukprot:CAMPEP_0178415172 /NCGR_PEP_ID=MMETSP0689_2-20121128/23416_1 /TAXON_ID=160604 /ORGANISM="Amphidinium massartii, Strain CS-259" /LENGTH=136 /DNA_ID=CAMNT_0020036487 /DNA_START=164 /DNA_END=570 /DNA_ORIENTATION=-